MLSLPEVEAIRAKVPALALGLYANHGGGSPASLDVINAISDHLHQEALLGPYEAGAAALPSLTRCRELAAGLVNAETDEIAFVPGASAGWGLAFAALGPLRAEDRILVSRQEWGGNLATLRHAADRAKARVEVLPLAEDGAVEVEKLADMMDDRVRLVSVAWQPANGGLIQDVQAIGQITRAAGVPFFVDAAQALGARPIDVRSLGCDVLTGSGRKALGGPRGIGLLYVRRDFLQRLSPVFLDVVSGPWAWEGESNGPVLREDARRFETTETAPALVLGLGAAIDTTLRIGPASIAARTSALASRLRESLDGISGVTLQDQGHPEHQSAIVSFTHDQFSPQEIVTALARQKIHFGAHPAAFTPYDMSARNLKALARVSLSHLNTEEEVDRLARAVASLV